MVGEKELDKITGMMMYYYYVCPRKLWYFCHDIQMEQENENVAIGKVLDETSYSREEKHINIDNVINIDFLRSSGVLHEVKKSKKIEEASIMLFVKLPASYFSLFSQIKRRYSINDSDA